MIGSMNRLSNEIDCRRVSVRTLSEELYRRRARLRVRAQAAVPRELNGPSCSGPVVGSDVVQRDVKVGDIIIIPAGTPHGWVNIPDHVDYLSFRPSPGILSPGYVHPSIKK
jgi:hypothetical protein